MLADQIRRLFLFNTWAWERVFASVNQLDDTVYYEPRQLFEETIHATLVHCLSAEYICLERCQGRSPDSLFDPQKFAGAQAIQQPWKDVTTGWQSLLAGLSDDDCLRLVPYRNTRGTQFELPLKDICHHVINHATEHRSQITPILFFLGVPTEPLDYILYCLSA